MSWMMLSEGPSPEVLPRGRGNETPVGLAARWAPFTPSFGGRPDHGRGRTVENAAVHVGGAGPLRVEGARERTAAHGELPDRHGRPLRVLRDVHAERERVGRARPGPPGRPEEPARDRGWAAGREP